MAYEMLFPLSSFSHRSKTATVNDTVDYLTAGVEKLPSDTRARNLARVDTPAIIEYELLMG